MSEKTTKSAAKNAAKEVGVPDNARAAIVQVACKLQYGFTMRDIQREMHVSTGIANIRRIVRDLVHCGDFKIIGDGDRGRGQQLLAIKGAV